jgi:Icc-related predicted phosphoesterase
MSTYFFVSDLHGQSTRYEKLFAAIEQERPRAVFLGGDLLASAFNALSSNILHRDFFNQYLAPKFEQLKQRLDADYPRVFLILGNDDPKCEEMAVLDVAARGLWEYAHNRKRELDGYVVYGYSYTPPSPFQLKDWERYDVSRYVDPGCVPPEEGRHTIPISTSEVRYATIKDDLIQLTKGDDLHRAIFLFHAPPCNTKLDRADLDGKLIDHVQMEVHVGSFAIERFMRKHQPLLGLHGHIHESTRLTGAWRDHIGRTHIFNAAHDGPELSLIRFDPENLNLATRSLL